VKSKVYKLKKAITEKLEMPSEVILKYPKITVLGKEEITIENHKGITEFTEKTIIIKSVIGNIKILGYNFEILYISSNTVILSGKFLSISYEGNSDV
jgi:sporulation protein YqfC